MIDDQGFSERYRSLPDSELARLAAQISSLVPAAQLALSAEMAARSLDVEAAVSTLEVEESAKSSKRKQRQGRALRMAAGFAGAAFLIGGFGLRLGGLGTVLALLLGGLIVELAFRLLSRSPNEVGEKR